MIYEVYLVSLFKSFSQSSLQCKVHSISIPSKHFNLKTSEP